MRRQGGTEAVRVAIAATIMMLGIVMAGPAPLAAGELDVAVIIGNRDYAKKGIPNVTYALRDALAVKHFATDLLSIPTENIIHLENASKGDFETAFGNQNNHRGLVWRYIDPEGSSNVLVYYSGHGVPGTQDKRGYLLPVNANPDTAEINGYSLELLYANLGRLATQQTTVYLDACFSGGSQRGMLIANASPFGIKTVVPATSGRLTVLAAASDDQIASWDQNAQHGLFTQHLLEGLYGRADRDSNRQVTVAELEKYLKRQVSRAARRNYGRIQNVSVNGTADTVLAALPANGTPVRPSLPRVAEEGRGTGAGPSGNTTTTTTAAEDEITWQAVRDLTNLSVKRRALQHFIKKYPDSARRPAAELLLESLPPATTVLPSPSLPAPPVPAATPIPATTTGSDNPAKPLHDIRAMKKEFVILKRSNIRSGPGTEYVRVGGLVPGQRIMVTGKVADRPWYRLAHQGGEAYIWEPLVREATTYFGRSRSTVDRGKPASESSAAPSQVPTPARLVAPPAPASEPAPETALEPGRSRTHPRTRATTRPVNQRPAPPPNRVPEVAASEPALVKRVQKEDPHGREWIEPSTGMRFVRVPGGSFHMGCGSWTNQCDRDEKPVHRVTLGGFWIGKYEVTQGEWASVMERNPARYKKGSRHPVERVSWNDAQRFVRKLNALGEATFSLPSEAQWEYACRSGGEAEKFCGSRRPGAVAWYGEQASRGHHEVGLKEPNGLGLHDMSGNVWEWVQDKDGPYRRGTQWNPVFEGPGRSRLFRGGVWDYPAKAARCANRRAASPDARGTGLGLRLVRLR